MVGPTLTGLRLGGGGRGDAISEVLDLARGSLAIERLLSEGYGYLSSGGKLMAQLSMRRSFLPLRPAAAAAARRMCSLEMGAPPDSVSLGGAASAFARRAKKRCRDVARCLRAIQKKERGLQFSLRLNHATVGEAAAMLRSVHKPCWVGPEMEATWQWMRDRGTMVQVELWAHQGGGTAKEGTRGDASGNAELGVRGEDAGGAGAGNESEGKEEAAGEGKGALGGGSEESTCGGNVNGGNVRERSPANGGGDDGAVLVAVDIGHPVGASFYVATRCTIPDPRYRRCQLGFLLALLSTRVLGERFHFMAWDLGGVDQSPLMLYKHEIACCVSRPAWLHWFRRCASPTAMTQRTGEGGVATEGTFARDGRTESKDEVSQEMVVPEAAAVGGAGLVGTEGRGSGEAEEDQEEEGCMLRSPSSLLIEAIKGGGGSIVLIGDVQDADLHSLSL